MDSLQLSSHDPEILPSTHLAERANNVKLVELPELRKSRLRRVFIIVKVLEAGFTLTAKSISRGFGISLRTAYRDIKEVGATGIPINRNEGGYTIDPDKWAAWSKTVWEAWIPRMSKLKEDEKA